MGLTSSLNIGATALGASQLAIQVTGNNLANVATPGYTRQTARLSPLRPENYGRFSIGTGVGLSDVRRQVDEALQQRLWQAISDQSAAEEGSGALGQLESLLDELGDRSVSAELRGFFKSWSERANLSQSSAVVVQQGQKLADFLVKMRGDLEAQNSGGERQLGAAVDRADGILSRIAELNVRIADSEATGGEASALRDQRDVLIGDLSQLMEVSVVPQQNGSVDVLAGSMPLVLGGTSRGLTLSRETRGTGASQETIVSVATKDNGSRVCVTGGRMGSMLENRTGDVGELIAALDDVATALIFEVNRLHSVGSNAGGFTSVTGTVAVPTSDRTRSMNDPTNTTMAGLPWKVKTGGFNVTVTSPTGAKQTVRVDIDLDGRRNDGTAGFEDDTSLAGIVSQLSAVPGLDVSTTPEGKLKIDGQAGFSFAFSDDSSGALAVLGVNTFFSGTSARDVSVRQELRATPSLLASGKLGASGQFIENGTALALAGLKDTPLEGLGGRSIQGVWGDAVQGLGIKTDAARGSAEAAKVVRDGLEAQRDAVSGVSVDEESINLINYQRMYQGAARFISVVDELTNTLLAIV